MGGEKPTTDGPGHRHQLHPTQQGAQKRERGSHPFDAQPQDVQRDRGRQRQQQERGGGDPDDGERGNQARRFELNLIRIALPACRLDWQCLLVSRAAPLAAVLQVTAQTC
jgi:hypothetical protein